MTLVPKGTDNKPPLMTDCEHFETNYRRSFPFKRLSKLVENPSLKIMKRRTQEDDLSVVDSYNSRITFHIIGLRIQVLLQITGVYTN